MKKLSTQELTLHNEFVRYGKNAKEWLRKCAILLPKINATGLWRKRGFTSIFHYAAVVSGMNHDQTREALRIMKRIQDKPALIAVAERKGLGAVRPVATIATKETEEFWAEKAENMTIRTLETYVRESRHVETSQPEKVILSMVLDPAVADQLEKMKGSGDWNELMKKLLEGSAKPEPVKTPSRTIPARITKYIKERTGEKCAYPKCFQPIHQLHHTQRWSLEQVHDPDRLRPLCKSHNEIAHQGLIENEDNSPRTWKLLRAPDTSSTKYKIDQKVMTYAWRGG